MTESAESKQLGELYHQMAQAAIADGIRPQPDNSTNPKEWAQNNKNSPLAQWIRANVAYRPDTEFFIVFGVGAAMGEILKSQEAAECKP